MLLALEKIRQVEKLLAKLSEDKRILDYKIVLQLSMQIEVHLLVESRLDIATLYEHPDLQDSENIIKINQVEFDEGDTDYYEWMFPKDNPDKVDLGLRRRLTNFIEINDRKVKTPCPVITFYSYKGGVGRSTALASFATYLAIHHSKKVVIIDCDFEAPGFTNYFDLDLGEESRFQKSGMAEYLLDRQYAELSGDHLDIRKDYSYEVRYEYADEGKIFVIPAGNLTNEVADDSGKTHRESYLEALARIDITSIDNIIDQFEAFFEELSVQLELSYDDSLILIDSRTGFNDTFALLACLSHIIVGFFGNNKQNKTGLMQFLDVFGTTTTEKNIVLVNSVSGYEYQRHFRRFVNEHIQRHPEKFTDEALGKRDFADLIYRIDEHKILERLGTDIEYKEPADGNVGINVGFIELIRENSFFKKLFEGIYKQIQFQQEKFGDSGQRFSPDGEQEGRVESRESVMADVPSSHPDKNHGQAIETEEHDDPDIASGDSADMPDKAAVRENLLRTLIHPDNFPKPYADNQIPETEDFYFRDCMKGLFNRDMFLVIGYKGTGKTLICQSFENPEILERLCGRANKKFEKYLFVNIIPIYKTATAEASQKHFSVNTRFELSKIGDKDFFFEKFWRVYIWSSVLLNDEVRKLNLSYKSGLEPRKIVNDEGTARWIKDVVSDENRRLAIEKDLKQLDDELKKRDKYLILSFDQLDFVVKPEYWSVGITPLINLWRFNIFSRIFPKLFLRADLYEKITGTNIHQLQEEFAISLAWKKEELFAYFFKFVFRYAKSDLFRLIYAYNDSSESIRKRIQQIESDLDEDRQIPVRKQDHLRMLVENFFGKYADRYDRHSNPFGESYDWFYNNLTDAKRAISIRPFLDLLHQAIESALKEDSLENQRRNPFFSKQVLPAYYYASSETTAYSAERYYRDLSREQGNEPLFYFSKYIKEDGPDRFRIYEFTREELDDLLNRILTFGNYQREESLKNVSVDDFKNLLINNGILEVSHVTSRRVTRYAIPFFYRSFLGVRNPRSRRISM
ncbi:hypothetical protein QUF72_21800 [Desulfobacterales bacterium HSG2]|nr:hypothetical protein [Desulfobacterales bacterium HSG2]